ncbi:MAG: hypothetical protein KGL75_04385 [Acidobacteriota bacterium]|nr:hypothetical protein [Acidobacteriota bacterium]
MPHIRTVFTPHPVAGRTVEQLWQYVEGPDPVSGKPLMKEIVDALTKPLSAADTKTGRITPDTGPATFSDTTDGLQELYLNNGMTDFLPIIIPTAERVDAMLKGTSHSPDELVGKMAGGAYDGWTYNVRQVAINAVMAGCRPEYLPTVLAIASTGTPALMSSTNSFAYCAVINGPIRDKLNMNYGIGALGPFAQPNAAIGRAWTVLSKNLANAGIPGDTYLGSQGNNLNYNNLIIAENEQASPWTPLHVQKGFKAEENVVSLFRGLGIVPGQGARGTEAPVPKHEECFSDLFSVFTGFFGALVVADPIVAKDLKASGYDTKEKLIEWLYKNTNQSVKDYKNRDFAVGFDYPRALKSMEPYATWYKMPDDAMIPRWPHMNDINIVVAGGQTNAFFQAGSLSYTVSASIDKWA